MKEIKSADKVVQQMTRDGAVEVNKATGGAERISARDSDNVKPDESAIIGAVVGRINTERKAAKKRAQRKANKEIFKYYQKTPPQGREAVPVPANRPQPPPQGRQQSTPATAIIPVTGRVKDKPEGKSETCLLFRELDKPPNDKLLHALDRPASEAANIVRNEARKSEKDNTGIEAAGATERAARGAFRTAGNIHSRLMFAPQKRLLRTENKAVKANINAMYKRNLQTNPELKKAGAIKKALYKRRLKKNYAQAFRQANKGAKNTVKTTKAAIATTLKMAKIKVLLAKLKLLAVSAVKAVLVGWKFLAVAGILLFMVIMIAACVSSCMAMFGGGFNAIIATSFTAEDEDIHGAHGDFTALETALAERIANIQSEFPGFDEYRLNIAPIGHDPFALISYLTAKYLMFTQDEVQASLAALFQRQYTLTVTPITEIRTRTEWVSDGAGGLVPVQVQYNWYVLVVTLVNRGIETAAIENLTPEQIEMFLVLMETQGNRPELFP